MSNEKSIKITVGEDGETVTLSGIPDVAWQRFKAAAKKQFASHGDDAWAAFLSEVIVAGAGGTDETVTYFMTDVPLALATATHNLLQQVELTWDQFHAMVLRSSAIENNIRMTRFHGEHTGIYIAMGLKRETFLAIEKATERSFEQVMGTLFAAAADGTVTFSPETRYIEPVQRTPATGPGQSPTEPGDGRTGT